MPWFVRILPVSAVLKLLKSVKIWQSCSQMYTATFYEPRQKCKFWYFQVRCAHKSGDVINFIIFACRIFSRLKWYKNYKNQSRLAKVIVKNKMSRFLWFTVYIHVMQMNYKMLWMQSRIGLVYGNCLLLYRNALFSILVIPLLLLYFV